VRTPAVRCFMDPVLASPFEAGFAEFDPPITIDRKALAQERCDVLIVSHAHLDHFCVQSLDRFHRDCLVVFPAGAKIIEGAVRRLGFEHAQSLEPGETVKLGDLSLCATPSKVDFPEMGMLFRSGGRAVWNMVDTAVVASGLELVRAVVKRVDLLLATHNPLLGAALSRGALGADFPFDFYGDLLRNVFELRPRCVVPGSCGFRTREPWVNDRYFPLTEAQFLADIGVVDPTIVRRLLPPGASIRVADGFPVRPRALRFVRPRGRAAVPAHDWRPERGVPPLVDRNPLAHPSAVLRARCRSYLSAEFLRRVRAPEHAFWRERMARRGALWRLEVVFPQGRPYVKVLDFGKRSLAWREPREGDFASIATTVAASAIIDLLDATTVPMNVILGGMRTMYRLYEPFRGGAREVASDDPLLRVLAVGADERYVDGRLRALGY
jgi:hypothetical protein